MSMWTFSFSPAKMSAPPYHPSLSSSPFHSQYHMPEIPSTPPPVALQPKSEVETFKRRISPIIPMILAFIHPIVVNFFVVDSSPNHRVTIISVVNVLSIVFWIYTVVFLMAPRFMYRGLVWLKISPWIISGLGTSALYVIYGEPDIWRIIYVCLASIVQVAQYITFIIEYDIPISFLLKPFERLVIPNMLAKFQLGDPNANLDACFGPVIVLPSKDLTKGPVLIRYGSQAVSNLAPQIPTYKDVPQPTPIHQYNQPQPQPQPQLQPPQYQNQYENQSYQNQYQQNYQQPLQYQHSQDVKAPINPYQQSPPPQYPSNPYQHHQQQYGSSSEKQ